MNSTLQLLKYGNISSTIWMKTETSAHSKKILFSRGKGKMRLQSLGLYCFWNKLKDWVKNMSESTKKIFYDVKLQAENVKVLSN